MSAVVTPLLGDRTRDDVWAGAIIDVDVHAVVPSIDVLMPYLSPLWQQHSQERGFKNAPNNYTYPPAMDSTARPEWRPDDGRTAASDVSLLQEHILDPWRVERAVVNCYYSIDLGHPDFAIALAQAVNDWLIAEWLDVDDRLRASIVLPGHEAAAMVAEIERVGDHPGFVQALLPVRSGLTYGQRQWHPVFEALARHDLVGGIHWGGSNLSAAPTPSGWPSWYVEEYVAEQQVYATQLTSLISEGVFQAVPEFRVSMLEIGFAWLPVWGWRIDKDWQGMRREIPWVKEPPMSLIRDHIRFSTAPIDAGPPKEMARIIEWLRSEDILMFATDYPHMHDDDLGALLEATPESMRPKLMADSAREWYRL
jgi:predicted TIM-barrel fold metal-dependent hydrolase